MRPITAKSAIALSVILTLATPALAQPLNNITISVPPGTTDHGDPQVLCLPAQWIDVLIFFLANYVAHAATLKSIPGEPSNDVIRNTLLALVLPGLGMARAMRAIFRRARFRDGCKGKGAAVQLQRAAQAGALLMLIRSPVWRPLPGDEVRDVEFEETFVYIDGKAIPTDQMTAEEKRKLERKYGKRKIAFEDEKKADQETKLDSTNINEFIDAQTEPTDLPDADEIGDTAAIHESMRCKFELHRPNETGWLGTSWTDTVMELHDKKRTVHGAIESPSGPDFWGRDHYRLASVPRYYTVREVMCDDTLSNIVRKLAVTSSYSWSKAVIGVFQTLYGVFTLYQSRGTQLQQYGYAAFGLTVTQYVVMTLLNLVGMLLTPEYAALYMVSNDVMDEARRRGYVFDGVVGRVVEASEEASDSAKRMRRLENNSGSHLSLKVEGTKEDQIITLSRSHPDPRKNHSDTIYFEDADSRANQGHPHKVKINVPMHAAAKMDGKPQPWNPIPPLAVFAATLTPLIIVGALSKFYSGQSTSAQRGWVMAWLVASMACGPLTFITSVMYKWAPRGFRVGLIAGVLLALFVVPAIGGFVVVGEMIESFGNCQRLY